MATVDLGSVMGPQGPIGETGDPGPQGDPGPSGPAGKTAYEYAVAGGYAGTEAEFEAMLAKAGEGKSETAERLQIARTINGAEFDGTKNINTAYAYNYTMPSSGGAKWVCFAKIPVSLVLDTEGSALLSDFSVPNKPYAGLYFVTIKRYQEINYLSVESIGSTDGNIVDFGWYKDDDFIYLGYHTILNAMDVSLLVMSNRHNRIIFGNINVLTTLPDNWIQINITNLFSKGGIVGELHTTVTTPSEDDVLVPMKWVKENYLKLIGGNITGRVNIMPDTHNVSKPFALIANDSLNAGGIIMRAKSNENDNVATLEIRSGKTDTIYYSNVKIIGVNNPTETTGVANKGYVDAQINALRSELVYNNAGAHNAIYRGKNLGTSVTDEQYAHIADGTFKDLFIGDYWVINGVNWRIAAFEYYLNCGDTNTTAHHAVIVPDTILYSHVMNDTNTTVGGYVGSKMYTEGLNQAKTIIKAAFPNHVLKHRIYLVEAVTDGRPYSGAWCDSEVDLMNEQMVYGGSIYMPIANGSGVYINSRIEKSQLPLFALDPIRISNRVWYWLRDVVAASDFASVSDYGNASYYGAGGSGGVRPAFCIAGTVQAQTASTVSADAYIPDAAPVMEEVDEDEPMFEIDDKPVIEDKPTAEEEITV